jgi:hypothetical protein
MFLVGKPEGEGQRERHTSIWEENIKMVSECEVRCENVE